MFLAFDYGELPRSEAFPEGTCSKRPFIFVELRNGEHKSQFKALIDTGSDFCVFPKSIADELSLNLDELHTAPALAHGGTVPLCFANVQISVDGCGEEWETLAGFAYEGCVPALGNIGFLDRFKVTFDQRNQYFEVQA